MDLYQYSRGKYKYKSLRFKYKYKYQYNKSPSDRGRSNLTQHLNQDDTNGQFNCRLLLTASCHAQTQSLHHFRDIAKHWSKIAIFSYPRAFNAPVTVVAVGILP